MKIYDNGIYAEGRPVNATAKAQVLRSALAAIVAATDNATDRGGPDSQWLVRAGGLRAFHNAIEAARQLLSEQGHWHGPNFHVGECRGGAPGDPYPL